MEMECRINIVSYFSLVFLLCIKPIAGISAVNPKIIKAYKNSPISYTNSLLSYFKWSSDIFFHCFEKTKENRAITLLPCVSCSIRQDEGEPEDLPITPSKSFGYHPPFLWKGKGVLENVLVALFLKYIGDVSLRSSGKTKKKRTISLLRCC